MQLGIDLYRDTIDLVVDAERRGAHAVWLTEQHGFEDGYLSQPLALAAALAVRTKSMRIGTAVLLAPLRHPLHVAEEAVLVDVLSDGRLELGLGAGYVRPEFEAFGADEARRYLVTEACVRRLQRLLAGGEPGGGEPGGGEPGGGEPGGGEPGGGEPGGGELRPTAVQ